MADELEVHSSAIVLGVEGGGSKTRAVCAQLDGTVLATALGGGANPSHVEDAVAAVHGTIRRALEASRRSAGDVAALVLGCAGLDSESDGVWARELTAVPGLRCSTREVNDAEVAHVAAFLGGPGIIAVSGTGSAVWGRTEAGEPLRNYDLSHYARSAARFLAQDAVHALLNGEAVPADSRLSSAVFEHFGASSLDELYAAVRANGRLEPRSTHFRYALLAPAVTKAAFEGSPLACAICDEAARALVAGVELVARAFAGPTVKVALVGGVARSAYFEAKVRSVLAASTNRNYVVSELVLTPAGGAALLALELAGTNPDAEVVTRLAKAPAEPVSAPSTSSSG